MNETVIQEGDSQLVCLTTIGVPAVDTVLNVSIYTVNTGAGGEGRYSIS